MDAFTTPVEVERLLGQKRVDAAYQEFLAQASDGMLPPWRICDELIISKYIIQNQLRLPSSFLLFLLYFSKITLKNSRLDSFSHPQNFVPGSDTHKPAKCIE